MKRLTWQEALRRMAFLIRDAYRASGGVSSGRHDSPTSHSKASSSPPPPIPTLVDEWLGEDGLITNCIYRMERDVEQLSRGWRGKPAAEMREERDVRIVERYEGWSASRAGAYENLSQSQIRRIRERAGKRPGDGR